MITYSYIDNIFYDAEGHTGYIYYVRLVNQNTGKVWDDNAEEVVASPTWANSVVTLTETPANSGQFPFIVPKNLPSGAWDVLVYKQSETNPVNTDGVESQTVLKKGGIFGF